MSIVPLDKVTLVGLAADKEVVLDGLQRLGCTHLISLRPAPSEPEKAPSPRAERAYRALKYLSDFPNRRRQIQDAADFDVDRLVEQALANQQRTREVSDRRDFLRKRIKGLEPWGDFDFPPEDALAGLRLWFYLVPLKEMGRVEANRELIWQEVHRDHGQAYVVVVAAEEPRVDAMPVMRTRAGALPLRQLQRRLAATEVELEELEDERAASTRWMTLLMRNLARAEDRAALTYAASLTRDEEGVFALQGWIPSRDVARLGELVRHHELAFLSEPPDEAELPPTLIEEPAAVAGGKDLVNFYMTPSYRSWDPSLVVFVSFALFFAMILSDAGYALLIGLLLAWFWRRLGASPIGRRLRGVGAALVVCSVAWGVLVGSYFGASPPEGSLLGPLKVLDLGDHALMMRLSIVIGVAHVALANGSLAWHTWGRPRAWAHLGWVLMLLGALLWWLVGGEVGLGLGVASIALGAVAVFWFSSDRAIERPLDWLLRIVDGLLAMTQVTKAFGDVLSYLRLFALGLASASLAVTFNQLAGEVAAAAPGVGLLFAILILLLGHAINLALAIMSGVVHGLRLNCIEFFNWGLPEEGHPFRSFAKKEVEL